jgi:hypothetical protein
MREITNGQLSIEQSAKHLATKILSILKDISTDEELSARKYPRVTQLHGVAFMQLRSQITIYAAKMLEEEWLKLSSAMSAGESLGEYQISLKPWFYIAN